MLSIRPHAAQPELLGGLLHQSGLPLLLVRRADRGLLGGLWELPNFPDRDDGLSKLLAPLSITIKLDTDQEVRHRYSHFEIRLRSLPRTVIPGRVARIDIESDRVNEERRVYVECSQCPETFHLGEQAEVIITTTELAEATLIPETAVTAFDGTSGKIWVVNDHKLQLLVVQFGSKTLGGRLQITTALPDGTLAVTELHNDLREGRRAKVAMQESP